MTHLGGGLAPPWNDTLKVSLSLFNLTLTTPTGDSIYCVTLSDDLFQPMCNHPASLGASADSLLGEEECRSPFGTYELVIKVDNQLSCDDQGITNRNCRDLQVYY